MSVYTPTVSEPTTPSPLATGHPPPRFELREYQTDPFAGLTRREIACVYARHRLWRDELASRVRRRIERDPCSPVASDQTLIRFIDARLAEIRRAMDAAVAS